MTTKNVRAQQTKTDEIDDLRARLTTAETEAVELLGEYQRVDEEARVAEARVEAAERERDEARAERDEYGSALKLLSQENIDIALVEQDRDVARQALSDVMRDRRAVGVCRDCGKHVGIRYAAEEGELRVYCIDCVWERWGRSARVESQREADTSAAGYQSHGSGLQAADSKTLPLSAAVPESSE